VHPVLAPPGVEREVSLARPPPGPCVQGMLRSSGSGTRALPLKMGVAANKTASASHHHADHASVASASANGGQSALSQSVGGAPTSLSAIGAHAGGGFCATPQHQFFGYTDNPTLAPIAQEPCRCQRYRHDSDHINCCHYHSGNWYRAHEHVLRAVMGIFRAAGYSSSIMASLFPPVMAMAGQTSTLWVLTLWARTI
jgi:hypothetical protein